MVASDTLTPNSHGRSSVKLVSTPHSRPSCFSDPRLSLLRRGPPVSVAVSNSHSVASSATAAPLSRLRRARLKRTKTILVNGFVAPFGVRFVFPDLPRLIRSRRFGGRGLLLEALIRGLHDSSVDDDAGSRILPQGDEELARERNDRRFARAAAMSTDLSWNHRLSAEPGWCRSHNQANWIMAVRSRGFPALDTPCSRSTDPLQQGVGAKPA